MDVTYYNDSVRNYLVIRCGADSHPDGYQYRMISFNRIEGLLPCSVREVDGVSYLYYDITSLEPLSVLYADHRIKKEDVRRLLYDLAGTGKTLARYLLDFTRLVLSPDLIFYDFVTDRCVYLYYPEPGRDTSLAVLLKFLSRRAEPDESGEQDYLFLRLLDMAANPDFILKEQILDREYARSVEKSRDPGGSALREQDPLYADYYQTGAGSAGFGNVRGEQEMPGEGLEQGPPSAGTGRDNREKSPEGKMETAEAAPEKSGVTGTFFLSISFLLAAIGTELVTIYASLPDGAAAVLRYLLLGFLAAAVISAAYGTLVSFRKVRTNKTGMPSVQPADGRPLNQAVRDSDRVRVSPAAAAAPEQESFGRMYAPAGTTYDAGQSRERQQDPEPPYPPSLYGTQTAGNFRMQFTSFPCTLGSDPKYVQCVIPDPSVERMHARISQGEGGELLLTDLNSRCGTFLNGVRLRPNECLRLQRGDRIRFGNLSFVFR